MQKLSRALGNVLLTDVSHAKNKPRADGNKILNISPTFDVISM